MTQGSCIYVGRVMHRRLRPRSHSLRYRVFWMLLDLDEIDELSGRLRLFSRNRYNLTSFFDRDHGDGTDAPLRQQIEAILRNHGYHSADINIKLLCFPRILGYGFNPLSIYFCHRPGRSLEAIIYEVHNTFRERHIYVFPGEGATGEMIHHCCSKQFHVSPFLGMDMTYTFRVLLPAEKVGVTIRGIGQDGPLITASLSGMRRELDGGALLKVFLFYPLLTLKVIAAIHWHALRMLCKGFHVHARKPAARAHMITAVNRSGTS